eukprot:TRINITY_DN6499_c0_g1_i5.p6 TRINITY_DN6499_c0_g1~~TRINITY_DN6499_c0_g1_i5.p6  ORF type:complete len:130 (+),score=3.99 TRINITY_DN6499_c0_g1_i5:263-652(+)
MQNYGSAFVNTKQLKFELHITNKHTSMLVNVLPTIEQDYEHFGLAWNCVKTKTPTYNICSKILKSPPKLKNQAIIAFYNKKCIGTCIRQSLPPKITDITNLENNKPLLLVPGSSIEHGLDVTKQLIQNI